MTQAQTDNMQSQQALITQIQTMGSNMGNVGLVNILKSRLKKLQEDYKLLPAENASTANNSSTNNVASGTSNSGTSASISSDLQGKKNRAITALNTYYPCFYNWLGDSSTYNEVKAYFNSSDSSVNAGLQYYFQKYGELPNANTNNCVGFSPIIYDVYYTVYYFNKYANINLQDNKNCQKLKAIITQLETEKLNIDKQHVADQNNYKYAAAMKAVNNLQDKISTSYASLSCDYVITQTQQQQAVDIINDSTKTDTTATGGVNVGTIVMYGLLLLVAGVVVKKVFF